MILTFLFSVILYQDYPFKEYNIKLDTSKSKDTCFYLKGLYQHHQQIFPDNCSEILDNKIYFLQKDS